MPSFEFGGNPERHYREFIDEAKRLIDDLVRRATESGALRGLISGTE
ncbi:hypothetical protein [Actinopolymorpha pittospori]|uniref:Uncharacterized protein n=1 Tax=Actinopolymorpha pittospori TaxID=648752 RepID=A0A927RIH4_9ACTN|nr:hypothetical protein [Actinopolymorpha pittospori]MBE1604548.1 hypothetical protein [Actinopolymorpha pittospori]